MAVSRQSRMALDATLRERQQVPVEEGRSDFADSMGLAASEAAAAVAAHEAAADPHPGYITAAELAAANIVATETTAAASKTTPVDADEIPLADSAASYALKALLWVNVKATMFASWGALIAAATGKTTPVDADSIAICDSAASNATKQLTFTNLKAFLKTYFDTLYSSGGGASAGYQVNYATASSTATASTTAAIPYDNTIPQNTEGTELTAIACTITPTAASSLLEVEVTLGLCSASGLMSFPYAIFRDSGANAIAAGATVIPSADYAANVVLRSVVAAGSTSATTFKFRYGATGGATAYINRLNSAIFNNLFGGAQVATMTVKEIKQ